MSQGSIGSTPLTLTSFARCGNRKSWIDVADERWSNLGRGWHGVESNFADAGVRYRWSQNEALAYLWNPYDRGRLTLQVLACSSHRKQAAALRVTLNDRPLADVAVDGDQWKKVTIDYRAPLGPLEIGVRIENPWRLEDAFHNGDTRELGLGVRRFELQPYDSAPAPLDGLSVVIPTFNRAEKLMTVLAALETQTLGTSRFEVIVVNDGSSDATAERIHQLARHTSLELRFLEQEHRFQGAARNLGIAHCTRPVVLFLGDDTIPSPRLLEEHLECHRNQGNCRNTAVLGHIGWPGHLRVTPFMDYVANYGAQFGYATICEGAALTFNCFYGSNVSVRREMLAELTHLFDEDFQTYGWEDTELGYRLERAGMRLVYHRKALALHDHSTNVREFCQRQYIVGKSSRILAQKHPQLAPSLGKLEEMHAWSGWKPLWGLAEQGVNLIDKLFRIPLPMRWYRYLLVKNYAEGVLSADRHGVPPGDPGGNQTVALASQATIGEDWPTTEIAPRLPREVPELCLPGAPYVDQMGPARAFEDLPVGP